MFPVLRWYKAKRPVIISHPYADIGTGAWLVHIWSRASGLTWMCTSPNLQPKMTWGSWQSASKSQYGSEPKCWPWPSWRVAKWGFLSTELGDKRKKNSPASLVGLGHSSASRIVSHCAAVPAETGYDHKKGSVNKMKCNKMKILPLIAMDFCPLLVHVFKTVI